MSKSYKDQTGKDIPQYFQQHIFDNLLILALILIISLSWEILHSEFIYHNGCTTSQDKIKMKKKQSPPFL